MRFLRRHVIEFTLIPATWLVFLGGQIAAGNSVESLLKGFSIIVLAVTVGGLLAIGLNEFVLWRRWPVIEETNDRVLTTILSPLGTWRGRVGASVNDEDARAEPDGNTRR